MSLAAYRSHFPGTQGRAYLDAACVSLLPSSAAGALRRLTEELVTVPSRDASSHHIALDQTAEMPRREIAKLINAAPADIALMESTTHALQVVAGTVPLGPGDRVLTGEVEFLGLAVPWIGRQRQEGFSIEVVPHRQGRVLAEEFERAMDERVKVVLLSSVQWNNGYRADLGAFSELCKRRGVVLVLDVIQQLGAVPLDVQATPADFVVCGGHKWLNAPVGRGFLYVAPSWQQRAVPARGYLQIREPAQGWAEYFATPDIPAVRDYEFLDDARAFELGGTANYPGNVVLGESVALLNEVGAEEIWRHVLELGEELAEGLERAGARVVSHRKAEERSGIVSFTLGQGVARDRAFLQRCWDEGVVISHRYTANVGGLRASVHLFNDADDVGRLLEAVRR